MEYGPHKGLDTIYIVTTKDEMNGLRRYVSMILARF